MEEAIQELKETQKYPVIEPDLRLTGFSLGNQTENIISQINYKTSFNIIETPLIQVNVKDDGEEKDFHR